MLDQPSQEATPQNLGSPRGLVSGTGVIRAPDGTIKGEFTFSGPATPEQVKEVFGKDIQSEK